MEQHGNGILEIDNNMTEKVTRAVHNISYIARSTFGRKSFDSTRDISNFKIGWKLAESADVEQFWVITNQNSNSKNMRWVGFIMTENTRNNDNGEKTQ